MFDLFEFNLSMLSAFAVTLTLVLALFLDAQLGEAKKYHYLVFFGRLSAALEEKLNPNFSTYPSNDRILKRSKFSQFIGLIAWLLLVLPVPMIYYFYFSNFSVVIQIIVDAIMLYLALGLRSLKEHGMQVYQPLLQNNLEAARHYTGYLVSRETSTLTPKALSRATVESILENGHDSVIASLTYYLIGGIPLVIVHRLANTLDAMWGYKSARYVSFGYASARLDDLLGFFSGKVCTVLYAIQGQVLLALKNAFQQGGQYKSHNGGWVMAAGATVMHRTIGGCAQYHGQTLQGTLMGCGQAVDIEDIPKSIKLVQRASSLFVFFVVSYQLWVYIF
ncbi:CobD/CbiB family cobalamin biosynthesis protein [Thalassotalea sediminis]|uniref:CobD/CbiB family cobalamin biosynthesis protein n=1 Tax=Thalassotalea sediminis TaxID=1759089 RepID=UPI0025744ADF|nr:CobD/CbiB family cobalamin biosynthesis protein [Thalassotalea sediminis]